MPQTNTRSLVFIITLVSILIVFSACRPRHSANEKRYDLKGKVLVVEKDKHLVTVAHDDIKDYMPGMTMPFTLTEDWAYEVLKPGDQISAVLVVEGVHSWLENVVITQESADPSAPGTGPIEAKVGDEVPNFRLVNQDGKAIRINDYRGKVLLLTFIYTRCPMPDQCTLMSNNFATIDQELQKDPGLSGKTHLLSISFDPEYDTPKVLRSYGAAFTGKYSDETFAHWEFASGSKDEVKGIAQLFGLRYYEDKDQVIHGLRTVIITPEGKVHKIYHGNDWKPEEVLVELKSQTSRG